ncbi:MAG: hypothetical protein Q9201_006769 [Fulgogasparrea decipioides]
MDVFYAYTYSTAAWLGLQATTLILSPTLIVAMLSVDARKPTAEITADPDDPKAPYAVPTLIITTAFHAVSALYSYMQYTRTGQVGFALGNFGSGMLSATGTWCLVFGTEKGRISKRTGADKRTSGWPFKNAESDKKKQNRKL